MLLTEIGLHHTPFSEVWAGPLSICSVALTLNLRPFERLPSPEELDALYRDGVFVFRFKLIHPDRLNSGLRLSMKHSGSYLLEALKYELNRVGIKVTRFIRSCTTTPPSQPVAPIKERRACLQIAQALCNYRREWYMNTFGCNMIEGYGFKANQGKPTEEHFDAIYNLGLSDYHLLEYVPFSLTEFWLEQVSWLNPSFLERPNFLSEPPSWWYLWYANPPYYYLTDELQPLADLLLKDHDPIYYDY